MDENEVKKIAQMSDDEFKQYKKDNKGKYTDIQMNQARKQRDVAANTLKAASVTKDETELTTDNLEKAGNALDKEEQKEAAKIMPEENFIENSTNGVANAKVGDKLRRSDGEVVTLTQADIDAAKAELAPKVEEPKVDANGLEVKENNDDELFQDDMIKPEEEMSEESKEATKELANKFGVPFGPDVEEEDVKTFVDSGNAIAVKDVLTGELTDEDGKPLPKEASIFPSEKPEDALNWFQNAAPALTVLSVIITAIGMANGKVIPPINFNKLSNRDEAYEAYLSIMEADQNQKNADTNAIETPFQLQERKEQYEEETGKSADDVIEGFGKFNEAGQMAVNKQQNEFTKEQMGLAQDYNVELKNIDQANALEQAQQAQEFLLQQMQAQNVYDVAKLKLSAEQQEHLAKVVADLDASFDTRAIQSMQDAGLQYKDIAYFNRSKSGRTNAEARTNMVLNGINTGINAVNTGMDVAGAAMTGGATLMK